MVWVTTASLYSQQSMARPTALPAVNRAMKQVLQRSGFMEIVARGCRTSRCTPGQLMVIMFQETNNRDNSVKRGNNKAPLAALRQLYRTNQ